jgi:hypothetical protein
MVPAALEQLSRRVRWRLLLVLGAVAILSIEVALRFTVLANVYNYEGVIARADDPRLPWRLVPGASVEDRGLRNRCSPVQIHINSEGWRDTLPGGLKPPGTVRVLALGDSDTFGEAVSLEDTWPKALERKLAAESTGSFEVYNRGVPGYDLAHFAVVLEGSWDLAPDLVIVEICPAIGVNAEISFVFESLAFRFWYLYRLWFVLRLNGLRDDKTATLNGLAHLIEQAREREVPILLFDLIRSPGYLREELQRHQAEATPFVTWLDHTAFAPFESLVCDPHPSPEMHDRAASVLLGAARELLAGPATALARLDDEEIAVP